VRSAGQLGDDRGQVGIRGRLQSRRSAVPPAAELAPHVAHHELRLVVERAQVRLAEELRTHLDRVHDRVERRPGVHHLERRGGELLEGGGRVAEHPRDPLPPGDRQPVGGQEQLGSLLDHPPQRRRPLDRVALHLLRVAGVGEVPDDEVARHQPAPLRQPCPEVVVGLGLGMVQLDPRPADVERRRVAERRVGPQRAGGEEAPPVAADAELQLGGDATELAGVDQEVPVVGELVAIEPGAHVLVADDGGPLVPGLDRRRREGRAATDVIGVAVRVHQRADRVGRPRADRGVDRRPGVHAGGVEAHQPVVRAQGDRVAEALDDGQAVGELGQLVGDAVDRLVEHVLVDDARAERQQVPHAGDATPAGQRGRPRTRSPRMLRNTFEVPPMIV
jgi:hypothetical protein